MTTWNDLDRKIIATCTIDAAMVLALANSQAHREMKIWAGMGMPRTWARCFGEAMTLCWMRAKTYLDNEIALRERAALPAAEQFARTADLNAALAERAIPPRPAEAREWRAKAAACRRTLIQLIAAE